MSISGSERQEKIIKAWASTLTKKVSGLTSDQAEQYVRRSIDEAQKATGHVLGDMDKISLDDPAKARFVGKVVSILYNHVSSDFRAVESEELRRILIEVYQEFPDHSS
ncbi:MAG: hypothetical protein KDC45_10690 [Bacteroidetes bacterium]|nr:hypothetical protein [Bacteroidota bacterium]